MSTTGQLEQRVVVTAAAQGIGRAIAARFIAAGAKVLVCDVDEAALQRLQKEMPSVRVRRADVSRPGEVEALIADASEALGGLDVLVNNAGVGGPRAAIEDTPEAEWDRTVAVNLTGAFHCIKAAVPHMKRQGSGVIINISTSSALTGLPMRTAYVATKAGLMAMTKNLARELGPHGIRCNAILPGMIDNPRGRALIQGLADRQGVKFEEAEAEAQKFISMRCWIDPHEIGDAAVFLASPLARHISGQMLAVDGHVEWEG